TSVNVFTGAPLFAMWVGSRVEGSGPLTMGVVFAVIATLALVVFLLTQALVLIGRAYDSVTGRPPRRERPAWLRSMRDEPAHRQARGDELSMLEKALVASVVVGIVAFELWFFLAAGSPLPNST